MTHAALVFSVQHFMIASHIRDSRVSASLAHRCERQETVKTLNISEYIASGEKVQFSHVMFFGFNSFSNNTPSRAVWVDKAILFFILRSLEARTALNSRKNKSRSWKEFEKNYYFFWSGPSQRAWWEKSRLEFFSFHYKIVVTARSGSAIVSCFQSLAVNSRILWPRLDGARLDHKVCWSYKRMFGAAFPRCVFCW